MKISAIVPIYKVEEYLERCVSSIINQSFREFELILVNDGSPDRCGEICDAYAAKDDRIKVIHKENGGLSDARNAGLKISQGEFIVFIDSDDWITESFFEKMLFVQSMTNADIVECGIIRTDCFTAKKEIEEITLEYREYHTLEAFRLLIQDNVFHQYVWNKMYRRTVIGDIFFEKGKTNEDEFWTYQVFGETKKVVWMNLPLYYYFQRNTSIMGSGYSIKRLDAIEAKVQRQVYIKKRYAELEKCAKRNLFGSCIYAGQMSLLYLSKNEMRTAKKKIDNAIKMCDMSIYDCFAVEGFNKIWFTLAIVSFWGTCKIKNWLKKGF